LEFQDRENLTESIEQAKGQEMRIVFFGTPAFAVPSLRALVQSGEKIIAVVTQGDKKRGRDRIPSLSPVK